MSITASTSAWLKAVRNSWRRCAVRVYRCGWNTTTTRQSNPALAAARVARISVGMVAVVVHHGDARRAPENLEAALHAREAGQRPLHGGEGNLQVEPDPDGGQRVEHVVTPGNLKRALAERRAAMEHLEAARSCPTVAGAAPPGRRRTPGRR